MARRDLPPRSLLIQRLAYDSERGLLIWRERPQNHFPHKKVWKIWNAKHAGKPAGHVGYDGYITICIDYAAYKAHRLIWLLAYGEPVPLTLDHIDGNGINNRLENIRAATVSQNSANRKIATNNTTGIKGVYYDKRYDKYFARIKINGKTTYLGSFRTLEEATITRNRAHTNTHGKFARHS